MRRDSAGDAAGTRTRRKIRCPQAGFQPGIQDTQGQTLYGGQRTAPRPYVVIDLETDGLDAAKNRIIEIGAVKVDGQTVSTFEQLIVHPHRLPKKITDPTGITDTLLADGGRPEAEAIKAFLAFIGSDDLIRYHVDFDVQSINQTLHRMDIEPLIRCMI